MSTTRRISFRIRNRMGHAGVDQSGLFMPGDDIDAKPQVPLGAGRNSCALSASRTALVATARTRPASKPRNFLPNRASACQPRSSASSSSAPPCKPPPPDGQVHAGFSLPGSRSAGSFDRLANHHAKRIGPQVNGREQRGVAFHGGDSWQMHKPAPGISPGARGFARSLPELDDTQMTPPSLAPTPTRVVIWCEHHCLNTTNPCRSELAREGRQR